MPAKKSSTTKSKTSDGDVSQNYEEIINDIIARYPSLSKGYQQIARFLTQNPNVVALETINSIARGCQTHPSSLVRFAQLLGFSGFKTMQAVFQTRLATAAPGFRQRINALESDLAHQNKQGNAGYLNNLVVRDIASLQGLLETVEERALADAARLLAKAETIYIAGQLRSEPISVLLRYLLVMLKRRTVLLDPAGGLAEEMAATLTPKDVLVAISFRHYAKEVVAITEVALATSTPTIAITDSPLSPIAKGARVLFSIPEDEYSFSRSLAAPMCLAQSLAVATAAALHPEKSSPPRIPTVTGKASSKRRTEPELPA